MPGPRSQIAAILSFALVCETLILNNERCNRYCQIRCVRKVNSGTGPITRKPGPPPRQFMSMANCLRTRNGTTDSVSEWVLSSTTLGALSAR